MANPDYGYCSCPVCLHQRAALRIAANGKAYISCDNCVSNVRTLSSVGDKAMRGMMTERAAGEGNTPGVVATQAEPAKAAVPPGEAKPAAPKKQGGFSDALDVLTGGSRK